MTLHRKKFLYNKNQETL